MEGHGLKALSDSRRERFCQEYLVDLNGTQAAIRAGYSARTARSQASRLLTDVNVKARVAELQAARQERVEVDQDWVLEQLEQNAMLARKTNQLSASNQAIIAIGKHHGMFVERVEQSGPDGGPIEHRLGPAMTDGEKQRELLRLMAPSTEAA